MNLTDHFTLEELVASEVAARKGIDNTPSPVILANLRHLAERLELVRVLLGQPMVITSGYRSPALNKAIKGAPKSHHTEGLAADFISPRFGTPADICRKIAASSIGFDQLIHEHTWCHISFKDENKRQVLTYVTETRSFVAGIVA